MTSSELDSFLQPSADRWEREGGIQALLEDAFPVHLGDDDHAHHALAFAGYAVTCETGFPLVSLTFHAIATVGGAIHSIREQAVQWLAFAEGPSNAHLVSTSAPREDVVAEIEQRLTALKAQMIERFAALAGAAWEPADLVAAAKQAAPLSP